ncbi:MAG: M14 family zinc carboxypeptidase [Methanobacteriota archaeon]
MRTAALGVAIAMLFVAAAPLAATTPENRALDGYAGYDDVKSALQGIAAQHPGFATLETLGTTFEGRGVLGLRLCAGAGPAALVMGGHHAREPASVAVALAVARTLADGYGSNGTIRWLLDNREIWLVPMVNPDGIEHVLGTGDTEWRKNRRPVDSNGDGITDGVGVDLNRNYGHLWGEGNSVHDPASQEYCGPGPFSEVETNAIRMLAEREKFSTSVSFHSYGELVYYPWNNGQDTGSNATLEALASEVAERNGYTAVEGHTTYQTFGDSDDWLYANMSAAPVTVEIGTGFFPDQPEIDGMTPGNVEAALYACEMAGRADDSSLPDWTVAVYMAADNNLADQALLDLNEMEAAPAVVDANVVVLYDGPGNGDSKLYRIAHDMDSANVMSPALDDGGEVIGAPSREVAMSEPSTLERFMDWTRAAYPSQRFAVVLWDHGNDVLGGLCLDAGMWLGTADACEVLRGAAPIDLVGLDLCWGASLEMAAELSGSARAFVASELEEPDTGWDYTAVLGRLGANTNAGPDALGKSLVEAYAGKYSWVGYGSMGAFSLPLLGDALDSWRSLSDALSGYAYYNLSAILAARNATGGLWSSKPNLVDVASLCERLILEGTLVPLIRERSENLLQSLELSTVAIFSGFSASGVKGLYVYHPLLGGFDLGYLEFDSAASWRQYLSELDNPTPRALVTAGAAPAAQNTTGPYPFEAWFSGPAGANVTLHYTQAGRWNVSAMAPSGNGGYSAEIPGQPDGTTISYYFESVDPSGFQSRAPSAGSYLSVVVSAFLDLYVGVFNTSGENRVGEPVGLELTAGNAGMEPCLAEVKLYSPDGLLTNRTVFLSNGRNAAFALNWTPISAGNATILATIVPVNCTVVDFSVSNNSARLQISVEPEVAKRFELPVAALLGVALATVAIAAAFYAVSAARRKRGRAAGRLNHAESLVADLEIGGYDVSGARRELESAREYLGSGRVEWAERAAERAESLALKAVSDGGGELHG